MTGHDDREWFGREPARPDETAYLEEQQERHRPAPKPSPDPVPAKSVEAMTGNELAAHMKARLLAMALTKEQLETIIGWREDIYSMVMPSEADILMPLRAALEIHDAKD